MQEGHGSAEYERGSAWVQLRAAARKTLKKIEVVVSLGWGETELKLGMKMRSFNSTGDCQNTPGANPDARICM